MTMKQSLYEPDYALECPPIWLLVEREMHGRLFCLLLSILPREWRAGMTASEYQADAFDAVIAWLCTGISIPSPGTYRESSSCTVAQPVLRQKPWLGQFFSAVLTKAALQMPSPRRSLKCPVVAYHEGADLKDSQTCKPQQTRGAEGLRTYADYSLANPDTLTKYKTAAQISQNVLAAVSKICSEGSKIVEICQKGDKLLEDEVAKVYKGKKITKGISHPCTVSPSTYVTPYTPLTSDAEEAETVLKSGEAVKIQLGAHIDGFGAIVCDTVLVRAKQDEAISGRPADLLLATHYANELLLRMMVPPGLAAAGTEEQKKKAQAQKPYSQSKITQLLEKVVKSYDCNLVENTTCWAFERNEIEGKKKIIMAPGEGVKGEGLAEVGEVWGVEVGVSIGTGKVKSLPNRPTLHRRTTTTYGLKRPSSRATLSEVQKKFGTFPFSLRQLEDERAGKVGIVECVRGGVVRQYEVIGSNDGEPVSRLFTTIAITKNGLQRLAAPPTMNLELLKSDKKITDEEILKILELPLAKPVSTKPKNKKKKKKPAKKVVKQEEEEEDDDDDDDEDDDDDDE
nr:curved DNA-binding protein-like [Quercus suber]